MTQAGFLPLDFQRHPEVEMRDRARAFYEEMRRRRSVRHFSPEPVPRELIELAILTASSAPSGANRQPWKFVAISDPQTKKQLREAVEHEEKLSYESRMPQEWLDALHPLGTDWHKPYLEVVPWVVIVFEETHGLGPAGQLVKNYYVKESVGIACGFFLAALHHMGLVTLTHTPSPMSFLGRLCARPENERACMLFPIGYPARDAHVPNLRKKSLDEVTVWITTEPPDIDRNTSPSPH